jgi:hypothetical protein
MEQFEQPKQRPTILTVFGILTFVMAGLTVLGFFAGLFSRGMSSAAQPPIIYSIIALLLAGGKVYGVMEMFKLHRQGFFIYTGAEVLSFILAMVQIPYTMGSLDTLPGTMGNLGSLIIVLSVIINLVFTGLWIGIYASQLKHME